MIIPWKVDVPQERLPLANWLIIAAAIGFFLWQINQVSQYHQSLTSELNRIAAQKNVDNGLMDPFKGLMLRGWTIRGLLGHMWLHGGWIHLIGNMFFLWIFGNAVCAKIGNITYSLIYIILGIAAGASHLFFSGGPALGASGAINGIVGMYLVLFPTNSITCLFLWYPPLYFRVFEVSSYAVILFWFIYDILGAALGGGNIAYFAHIGGFVAGLAVTLILLKIRLIKMAPYEKSLLGLISDKRSKPQLKNGLYSDRVLLGEYNLDPKPTVSPAEPKQIPPPESAGQTESLSSQSNAMPNDGFIRVYCTCGRRCKIPVQYVGKTTARCPQCKQPLKIPDL